MTTKSEKLTLKLTSRKRKKKPTTKIKKAMSYKPKKKTTTKPTTSNNDKLEVKMNKILNRKRSKK